MNHRTTLISGGLLLGLAAAASAAGKPLSDLVSTEKRKATVELAQRLARAPEPAPLPGDLIQPFNPPNFDQPDPEELRAAAAAAAKAGVAPPPLPGPGGAAVAQPARPVGDRDILETIAAQIRPSGMLHPTGKSARLTFGRKTVEIGGRFTVTNPGNGQEYELELVAIEPPTFTLRYRNEEITRPIKSGK
ncbi:MAG: hypothetical protein NTV51_16465 [Verrucomicrobia bacterium]|nr:hypothetical protein [Verrucomicrobiota bacterium]